MAELPTRVGDYLIEAELGVGGMATVYKARHAILDTLHAIKVLAPSYRENPAARQRFLDEARIQAKHLDHPSIIKVTNVVATPEHAALVMELVDGANLDSRIAELRDDPPEVRRIMLAILDAVEHAHRAGIIHRDLKPANVMLAQRGGRVVPMVTDFGIAKITSDATAPAAGKASTHADARMGTLHYMSPEQIRRAKDVTPRSDVFSLGAMLYEMATGTAAFGGGSDYDVMDCIVRGTFEPPARRFAAIDPVLAAVIAKALSPDPADRFASCAEFAQALRGEVVVAPARMIDAGSGRGDSSAVPAKPRRPGGLAIALILGSLAIGGGGVFLIMRQGTEEMPYPSTTDPASPRVASGGAVHDAGVVSLANARLAAILAQNAHPAVVPSLTADAATSASATIADAPTSASAPAPAAPGSAVPRSAAPAAPATATARIKAASLRLRDRDGDGFADTIDQCPDSAADPNSALDMFGEGCPHGTLPPRGPAPPVTATTGYLQLFTTPTARVFVDGIDTGMWTPVAGTLLKLTPGKHKVTFVIGDDRYTFATTIRAGATESLTKNLQ